MEELDHYWSNGIDFNAQHWTEIAEVLAIERKLMPMIAAIDFSKAEGERNRAIIKPCTVVDACERVGEFCNCLNVLFEEGFFEGNWTRKQGSGLVPMGKWR